MQTTKVCFNGELVEIPKFKPAFKKKLVNALRSKNYTQIEGSLHNGVAGEFCALGVAMDVMGVSPATIQGQGGLPDGQYLQKMGIDSLTAEIIAEKNDDGWSFRRIATWIEKFL